MRFRAHEAAAGLGARLVGDPDAVVDGVSFDSRTLRAGQLFVPLVAERDGHDFLPAAAAAGAAACLTARPDRLVDGATAIVVDDTLDALMRLGAWARVRWAAQVPEAVVVGITGSVGKTSTKDLAAAALAPAARTWASERSFNNDQGLPSTILNAPDDTEVMVLEMGMRGFGQIARLAAIAQPTVGLVTRIAEAHTQLVGDLAGVARAKRELVEALPAHGTAVLNADQPLVREMAHHTAARALLVGTATDADVRIDEVFLDSRARGHFTLDTPWGSHQVHLATSGAHMVSNAAAALAVAGVLGHDLAEAVAALATATLTPMRMDVKVLASGLLLVDDSYNANPASMRAALDALAAIEADRRVALLGPMAELADSAAEHLGIAGYAQDLGIELRAVGTSSYGVEPLEDAAASVDSLAGGSAVLVKASRSAGLDRLAGLIVERHGGLVLEEHDGPA